MNLFSNTKDAIEDSKFLLSLKNKDGELIASEVAWKRATDFLSNQDDNLQTPLISSGPDSSIDLLWDWKSGALLINVDDKSVNYYGIQHMNEVKGSLDINSGTEFFKKMELL